MVAEAMKSSHLIAYVFSELGYEVNPLPFTPRRDIIQAVKLGSPDKLVAFCRAIQKKFPHRFIFRPCTCTHARI